MTPPSTLNTFQPGTWAQVVSPMVWGEYGLSETGQVEGKATCGPLILWSKTRHLAELIELRQAYQEIETMCLNPRETYLGYVFKKIGLFSKFRTLAKWKYHNSVTTKVIPSSHESINALTSLPGIWNNPELERPDLPVFHFEIGDKSYRFQPWELKNIFRTCFLLKRYSYLLLFILVGRDSNSNTQFMQSFVKMAYRVHLAKRVKPAPRRGRIPRPAHAVPRPPTAPLAPPVTC